MLKRTLAFLCVQEVQFWSAIIVQTFGTIVPLFDVISVKRGAFLGQIYPYCFKVKDNAADYPEGG